MSTKTWQKRFQQTRKLADTLQGHIYLAKDLQHSGRNVVVKETYKTLVDSGKSRDGHVVHEDFHNETRLLTYLSKQPDADEGFCRIIFEWESDDCFYYAMQWCEAELFKYISNSFAANGTMYKYMQKETNKPQTPCDKNDAHSWLVNIRSVFRQCVQACYWMQTKGVCHLDLSLENTMIYKVDGLKVKIIDFGLSKHYDYKNNEKHANFLNDQRVGKRGYMAPEVYNKMIYDARRADIWSLGVMLFMMLVGAPPYKRATQRDAAFNYIINGMLEDVLKHWRRLRLISKDALDCMEKIFKWEKDRITMKDLVMHPFVDLPHLRQDLGRSDPKNSYVRITNVVTEYHNKYALPMQAQYNKDGDYKSKDDSKDTSTDDNQPLLITFTADKVSKSDKLVLPSFVSACKEILGYGNIRLLDDFNHILSIHSAKNLNVKDILSMAMESKDSESESEEMKGAEYSELYDNLTKEIKNKAFILIDHSIIIRRNFRNRQKCEDEKALLEVYGKYNKNVINDDGHRMAMQIMDKIYFYFAYTYNFGYTFTKDEIKQLTFAEKDSDNKPMGGDMDSDAVLGKVKQLLKRKKQEILKTKHGKQIYTVMRDRKVKYCTMATNCFNEEAKDQSESETKSEQIPGPCIKICAGIKARMAQYLLQMKNAPKSLSHRDFIKFLKTLQIRCKKDQQTLKTITSEQWKMLISKFDAMQMSEAFFTNMGKKQFGKTLIKQLQTGNIVKLHKVIESELVRMQKERFFTKKDKIEACDNREIVALLFAVLRETDKIDIENDLNIEKVKDAMAGVSGKEFAHFDEEYIINRFIVTALFDKFGDINSHRFGKRFRYWPAYSDNKSNDLLNGFYTHHWYVRPKFNDIKDEILNNGICCITVNQWNRTVLYASKVIIRTIAIKKLKATVTGNRKKGGSTSNSSYNKYGVKNGDRIRLEHLVPLLIYINLDFVSKELVKTYNNHSGMEYAQWIKYMKHHSQLSHLARLVRETVECYGQCSEGQTFYHLCDKSIPSSSLKVRLFSPTSVTASLSTAFVLNDFDDSQVIFELKSSRFLKYFNCNVLSDYCTEFEYIVCGGLNTLRLENVYDLCHGHNYCFVIKAMQIFANVCTNRKANDLGVRSHKAVYGKIGQSLNKLMQNRYKNRSDSYIDAMFAAVCNNICYAQINLKCVTDSPLMKAVLCNKDTSIRFDVLSAMLPKVDRYFVTLSKDRQQSSDTSVIFNENLVEMCGKSKEKNAGNKSIKFAFVDSKTEKSDLFKSYKDKFDKIGYQMSCHNSVENGEKCVILSIECRSDE